MRAWPSPDLPALPGDGAGGARARHASGRSRRDDARRARPGSTSAASRRTTPPTWATPPPTSPSTCSTGPGATRATTSTYVQNVTDVDDPLLERADEVGVDWRDLAEREIELFRQDMTALRVLPPASFVGAVESIPLIAELIGRLARTAGRAVRRRSDDLYFSVAADPAFGEESALDPRADARDLRRARRRPRPAGQEGPARLPGLARRAAGRAGLGQPVRSRAARAGTSSASAIALDLPRRVLRRAGRRHRPGLPAPRDVRRPRRRCSPARPFARAYVHAGDGRATTARRCRSRAATWSSSRRCATATSTRWRSG